MAFDFSGSAGNTYMAKDVTGRVECLAIARASIAIHRPGRVWHDRDAWRLADYYAENRHFSSPWEPVRD